MAGAGHRAPVAGAVTWLSEPLPAAWLFAPIRFEVLDALRLFRRGCGQATGADALVDLGGVAALGQPEPADLVRVVHPMAGCDARGARAQALAGFVWGEGMATIRP